MKITLTKKYIILGTIGLLAVVSAFTIINTHSQNANLKQQYLDEAKNLIRVVEKSVAEDINADRIEHLQNYLSHIKESENIIDVIIFNDEGTVISGNAESYNKNSISNKVSITNPLKTRGIEAVFISDSLIVNMPVQLASGKFGGITIIYSLVKLNSIEYQLLARNILIGVMILIAGMALLLFYAKKVNGPIRNLIEVTREVAEGNYDKKIEVNTHDELELLSRSFNIMTDKLKSSHNEMLAALQRAERSDTLKSEFLAQMSHEIRTPVNAIVNFTGLLRNELAPYVKGEIEESFDIIEESSSRLIRTIELIIDASELQTGNFQTTIEELDIINDIISPLVREFKFSAAQKKLELGYNNPVNSGTIMGDKYSLKQLFANLIDNSIKYTHEGYINIKLNYDEKNNMVVEIEDSGIGIAEDFLPFLFEPFTQEDQGYSRKYEGTGLGLSLVKKYCELNNADIKVTTQKGKGTKFSVTFNSTLHNPS